ncbi:MAG: aspartate--tRNA ligase [Patescibacteria group bacterium]
MKRIWNTETLTKEGEIVRLCGWAHSIRRMGDKLIFVDLRDKTGLIQLVFYKPDLDEVVSQIIDKVRPEYVLQVEGVVQKRNAKSINPDIETGIVEIAVGKISILSEAKTPPFEIDKDTKGINEELRLKYRYLDLRSSRMKKNIEMRQMVFHFVRNYLHNENFTEVQTPILTKSTPEGARDYLVPSRKFPGKFFALPQSPQQYKQLLMVAGIERYFQISPCFRDEDARADRSPGEFYQIDMEMSFMSQDEILELVEKMFTKMVQELFPEKKIMQEPWPKLNYSEVMEKYGTDKPDLRNDKNDPNELAFAWVVNFPLFVEQSEDDHFHGAGDKLAPSHHMFTAPKEEDIAMLDSEPLKVRSYQHDLVLNGIEVGGGSIRIHDPELQAKIFDLIGFSDEQKEQFGHMLEAFEYGVPPHGGVAPGFDRLVSILAGENNIREVIAFPLMGDARDPLMDAPSQVSPGQLKELGIEIKNK